MAEVSEQHPPEFPPVSRETWREAVEAGLRGKRIEDKLTTTTSDGLLIQPLYGDGVEAREGLPWSDGSWQPHEPFPATPPADLREHLQRAVDFGVKGLRVGEVSGETEQELLELAGELGLDLVWTSPVEGPQAQERLKRGFKGGQTLTPGALTEELAGANGANTLCAASSSEEQSRGAGVALQVAICLGQGARWLREAECQGIPLDRAAALIEFRLGAGTDLFLEVAKLRALRLSWTKLLAACQAEGPCRVHVHGSPRSWTVRDPWVNGLRGTTIAVAAAIGGAESVLVLPFDALLGNSDEEALRLARNTHAILAQESHLHRVQDPAAGSGYVESLTEEIAQKAWALFQRIEAAGSGAQSFIEGQVAESAASEARAVATRRRGLIGVSEFPNLEETLPARSGSTLHESDQTLAAPYEALRARSDRHLAKHGSRPTAFLCNLGRQAEFRARSGFASNLLGAGGIAVIDNDGFPGAGEAAEAFTASGLSLAVIASTDELYAEHVPALASALRERGATVILAGRPGDNEAAWTAAGVDTYIYLGCDALATLNHLHTRAEVTP